MLVLLYLIQIALLLLLQTTRIYAVYLFNTGNHRNGGTDFDSTFTGGLMLQGVTLAIFLFFIFFIYFLNRGQRLVKYNDSKYITNRQKDILCNTMPKAKHSKP